MLWPLPLPPHGPWCLCQVGVHNLSPGMVTTDLLMAGADNRVSKFFINWCALAPGCRGGSVGARSRPECSPSALAPSPCDCLPLRCSLAESPETVARELVPRVRAVPATPALLGAPSGQYIRFLTKVGAKGGWLRFAWDKRWCVLLQ